MSKPISFNATYPEESSKLNHLGRLFYKGEKVMYEGEEAVIISVKPFLVIKSSRRVVCGDLYKYLDPQKEKNRLDKNLH